MPSETEKFHELIEKFDTCVLVTHARDETTGVAGFDARPMAIAKLEANCDLWFLTGADSAKVFEIGEEPRVLVVFQEGRDRTVTLAGRAEVLRDVAKQRELFNVHYKAWFPDGPEGADVRLIRVRAEAGEYWDSEWGDKVKYLFQVSKAVVTGSRPEIDEGDQHGRVRL